MRRCPFADQPMRTVDRDMVLVAESGDGEIDLRHAIPLRLGFRVFDRPARVAILLSELRGLVFPVRGNATFTERLLLLLCVALLRRRDDRGIDNLAAHRQEARSPQKLVEAPEQGVDSTGSLQSLPECPDRIGIGNRIRHADPQEYLEINKSFNPPQIVALWPRAPVTAPRHRRTPASALPCPLLLHDITQ